ncbi:hypothetical protein [Sulfurirhabdus autotrophica]|uniref:Uncharacterized protein n=1 Tax=Sulfurirhabdus autotrophica TaxID=1706046 RepID=A0A4R3Y1Q8_9PROT|nr:hypothetical protein [Sulfurirhabdus autotrophica]TCV85382.1 hypothetical protein EDC63_10953 [Sulfurirhabdus autotrophica]
MHVIVLLAFLQCFAPLLHAHALGNYQSSGVHFHLDYDMLEHSAKPGKAELQTSQTELPAITMAQEFKKDAVLFIITDVVLPFRYPSQVLNYIHSRHSDLLHQPLYLFTSRLPPAQAPPYLSA